MTERFVIVGAGTMGLGIGYVAANAGYATELVEVDSGRAAGIRDALQALWDSAVARGRMTDAQASEARERVAVRASLREVPPSPEIVVEAVPEQATLKRQVLLAAEALRPGLLGTNTSSISIGELSAALAEPSRLVGLHFFNPVWAMELLEIVLGAGTADQVREEALALAARLGKTPIVVRDLPGFATSRLGVALGLEAIRMVEQGVASAADIDKAMVLGYRHPVGPLELGDVVGLDVRLDIARALRSAYGDRFAPPALLERMVTEGRLGRKTGQGFYRWVDGRRQ